MTGLAVLISPIFFVCVSPGKAKYLLINVTNKELWQALLYLFLPFSLFVCPQGRQSTYQLMLLVRSCGRPNYEPCCTYCSCAPPLEPKGKVPAIRVVWQAKLWTLLYLFLIFPSCLCPPPPPPPVKYLPMLPMRFCDRPSFEPCCTYHFVIVLVHVGMAKYLPKLPMRICNRPSFESCCIYFSFSLHSCASPPLPGKVQANVNNDKLWQAKFWAFLYLFLILSLFLCPQGR